MSVQRNKNEEYKPEQLESTEQEVVINTPKQVVLRKKQSDGRTKPRTKAQLAHLKKMRDAKIKKKLEQEQLDEERYKLEQERKELEQLKQNIQNKTEQYEDLLEEEVEEEEKVIDTPKIQPKTKSKKKKEPKIIYEENLTSNSESESDEYIIRRVRKTKKTQPKPEPNEIEQYQEPQKPQREKIQPQPQLNEIEQTQW